MKQIIGQLEARKHSYRQSANGIVISFLINPEDMTPDLAAAPLNTAFALSFCSLDYDNPEGQEVHVKDIVKPDETDYTKALKKWNAVANDEHFINWIGAYDKDGAIYYMKADLGISSATELSKSEIRLAFSSLVQRYQEHKRLQVLQEQANR